VSTFLTQVVFRVSPSSRVTGVFHCACCYVLCVCTLRFVCCVVTQICVVFDLSCVGVNTHSSQRNTVTCYRGVIGRQCWRKESEHCARATLRGVLLAGCIKKSGNAFELINVLSIFMPPDRQAISGSPYFFRGFL
jgi:hypothetical protein